MAARGKEDGLAGNMNKLENSLERAGGVSKRIDWPVIVAVVTIVAMVCLMVAIIFRRQFRMQLFDRAPYDYYMSKHLPVSYLTHDGNVIDLWVTPSEFVSFGGLYNIAKGMKHGMCTDDAGWTQFCLFAAAKAYETMRKGDGDEDGTVEEIVAESIEKSIRPYLRFLCRKIGGASDREITEELDRVAVDTNTEDNFRGVKGRAIPRLTDTVRVVAQV